MIYISCDIETDGPIAGIHSMLSIGLAAFNEEGVIIDKYYNNLKPLEGAIEDPETMEWWTTEPRAWKEATSNPQDPAKVVHEIVDWTSKFTESFKLVGYPLSFDQSFINWYMMKFTGKSTFGFNGIDIRSYIMGMMNRPFNRSSKKYIPKYIIGVFPHTHNALDDAISQGHIFFNLKKLNLNQDIYDTTTYPIILKQKIEAIDNKIETENQQDKIEKRLLELHQSKDNLVQHKKAYDELIKALST